MMLIRYPQKWEQTSLTLSLFIKYDSFVNCLSPYKLASFLIINIMWISPKYHLPYLAHFSPLKRFRHLVQSSPRPFVYPNFSATKINRRMITSSRWTSWLSENVNIQPPKARPTMRQREISSSGNRSLEPCSATIYFLNRWIFTVKRFGMVEYFFCPRCQKNVVSIRYYVFWFGWLGGIFPCSASENEVFWASSEFSTPHPKFQVLNQTFQAWKK